MDFRLGIFYRKGGFRTFDSIKYFYPHIKSSLDRLLHIDGFSALTAGVSLLLLRDFLSGLLDLPVWLLTAQGFVNIAYSAYSLPLARRKHRPEWMVRLLAIANMLYAFICVPLLLWHFFPSCNALGVVYFGLEIRPLGVWPRVDTDF